MNEDVLDYLFKWAQDTGYKYSREDFVKLIQSNDKVLNRAFEFAQSSKKPYKKDIDSFALLVGRTKPQSTQSEPVATEQPAKVEPITTEPAKVTPQAEPQATETVTDNVEEPVKEPIVENKPAIQVKEVEAKKEEVANKEIPREALNQNIIPITEKTEVKAVKTPSDKMVVKSEKKEEVKEQPKTEGKPQVEVKDVTKEESDRLKVKLKDIKTVPFEPNKKYKPYGEKGPDVYYYEDYDQYVIKEGDKNIIAKKGSDKYNELDSKIGDLVKGTKYGKGECPEYQGGCPKNIDEVRDYFQKKGRGSYETIIVDREANLVDEIDGFQTQLNPETKKIEKLEYPSSMIESYESGEYKRIGKTRRYVAEEPPKSERFSIYKPFGENGKSFIYDNKTEVIMQETDDKIMSKDGKPMTTWIDIPMPEPEYKEAKSLIEGLKFQKEKGSKNTFVPLTTTPGMPEWLKNKNTSEQPQVEVKDVTKEESDRLKVKPLDEKVIEENKKSMEYPTPPSDTVFDVKKIKGKELYSSYDKENNKWYTYPVGSNKKEWTEVKSGQMKSALNAMFTSNKLPNKADAINLDDTIKKSKVTEINLDTFILDSKNKEIKADIPTFELPKPSKKYKPYGEKGPDVYYSEYYDQYVIKEGDKKILAEKGSDKYNELDSKIGKSAKATIEGTGKCDPDRSQEGCTKNGGFLNNFLSLNNDNYEIGFRTTTEGILINKLNEDKEQFEEEGESRYVKFSNKDLETQSKEYNMLAGQIWYANDEPPKDKRFVIYKPYGNDDTLIYDKESEVILKQVGKAPYVSSRDLSGENDVRQTYKKIQQENPNEGLNVWYGYHKDRPEYKELKSLIDGMDYKKEKGSKNTFIPLTTTPGMPEWSPIPNKK